MTYVFKTDKYQPYAHQIEAFERSKDEEFFAYLMEMGTAKTRVAIDNMGYLFEAAKIDAALIIVPKTLIGTWAQDEIPAYLPTRIARRIIPWKTTAGTLKLLAAKPVNTLDILVMGIDALNGKKGLDAALQFVKTRKVFMAVDESSIIKGYQAQRTKNCIKVGQSALYRRILNGTPVPNSPLDVFSQFYFLSPDILGHHSFFTFRSRYAKLKENYINGRTFKSVVGFQRLDEMQALIYKYAYRKLKVECLDLPPKVYAPPRYVEMEPKQRQAYDQLKRECYLELTDGALVATPLPITREMKLRQILCGFIKPTDGSDIQWLVESNPKIEALTDIIENNPEQKFIAWCSFTPSMHQITDELRKLLGTEAVVTISGEVSEADRDIAKNRFQNDESVRGIVIQNKTGQRGLTLTAATLVIYFDNDWSLETREQSEDRCHRSGQTKSVTYIDLVVQGTVDETVIKALREKKNVALEVTGDLRGN